MRIDVLLGEAHIVPADVADRVVVVIDVLRAATTVAAALHAGARTVIPFETVEETAQRARAFTRGDVLLAGRTILYTTTNGTVALVASHGARACFLAAFVTAAATIAAVRTLVASGPDVTIICAGHERRVALEDVVCAGRLVRGMTAGRDDVVRGDGARVAELVERPFQGGVGTVRSEAVHASSLAAAGFAHDVEHALRLDQYDRAVRYRDRQLQLDPATPAEH